MKDKWLFLLFFSSTMGLSAQVDGLQMKSSASHGLEWTDQAESGLENGGTEGSGYDRSGKWDLTLGTGFSYSRAFGSGASVYAAPFYTLPLNDRWSLHGGVIATHTTLFANGFPASLTVDRTGSGEVIPSYSSLSLFGAASYRLNDRLVLHGAGVKTLASYPHNPPMLYHPLSSSTMDHLTVGATYQLRRNITLGASFRIQNHKGYHGLNGPYNSPFGPEPFGSPLGW